MSAHPLNPLPSITPGLPTSSNSLRAAPLWAASPFPTAGETIPIGKLVLPHWPETHPPAPAPVASPPGTLHPLPSAPVFQTAPPVTDRQAETPAATAPEPDFTDDDLRQAFAPLFKDLVIQAAPSPLDAQLEPMLRATIRRALAEYSPGTGRPFQPPGTWDRFKWRMQALFTSRTYEDILFEKTNRFQVEEVFLVDAATLALVSYASSNPGRHGSAKRVAGTIQRLALQMRDADGNLRRFFKLPDERNVIIREGRFITLLAIFRGMPNEMAINDLGYTLETIEERFRERFDIPGSPLLKVLQPFLEDCLLIQAPASAA